MSQHLTLEISDVIYSKLQEKADACGLSLSDWAASVLDREARDDFTHLASSKYPYHEHYHPNIIRTERGLTIAGTRITLYQLMDYILANYPPPLIRHQFHITDEQFSAAIAYIERHYESVEAEYQIVLQQADESREFWDAKKRERDEAIAQLSPKAKYQAAWEKLQACQANRATIA